MGGSGEFAPDAEVDLFGDGPLEGGNHVFGGLLVWTPDPEGIQDIWEFQQVFQGHLEMIPLDQGFGSSLLWC